MQQLKLGSTYRVTFKPEFAIHGYQKATEENSEPTFLHEGKGVARIEAMMSFNDLVKSGINLYESFFKPCGITEEQYLRYFDGKPDDIAGGTVEDEEGNVVNITERVFSSVNYSNYPIYKFVDAIDSTDTYYVPQEAMASFPEVDINPYLKLMMTVDFGAWADVSQLQNIEKVIADNLNLFGLKTADVRMMVYDTVFMTTKEYEEMDAERKPEGSVVVELTTENISLYVNTRYILSKDGTLTKLTDANQSEYIGKTVTLVSLNSSFATNYFLRWKLAEQELLETQARCQALEELVIQLSKGEQNP